MTQTNIPTLTGNPSDDVDAISAGTGEKISPVQPVAVGAGVSGATASSLMVTDANGDIASGPTTQSVVTRSWLAINVMDPKYGAKGDGSTDDTAAIQAAVNAAGSVYANTGGIVDVVFPAGYKFRHGQILATSGVRLWGYGATIQPTASFGGGNGALFKNPTKNSLLQSFEIRGLTFIGNGTETSNNNNMITGQATGCGWQDVVIRDTYVKNWGACSYYFLNPTRVQFLNNTIMCNEVNNAPAFQNTVSFDFDGTYPALGQILVHGNYINNATADSIAVVLVSGSAPNLPANLGYTVTNNLVTADPPTADAGCTFNGTTLVLDPNASSSMVGQWVTGPGVPNVTYIQSCSPGVSYTLSKASTFSGSGTLYVRVFRSSISCEIDNAANVGGVLKGVVYANNQVTGYERTVMGVNGSNQAIQQAVVKGNILVNGQIGATGATGQGQTFNIQANGGKTFDVAIEGNYMTSASGLNPIYSNGMTNMGRQRANKFTTGPAEGTATLGGNTPAQLTAASTSTAVTLAAALPVGLVFNIPSGTAGITNGTTLTITGTAGTASTTGTLSANTTAALNAQAVNLTLPGGIYVPTIETQSGDIIIASRTTAAGTLGSLSVGSVTAGNGFVILSSSTTDTSGVFWEMRH